MVFTGVRTHVVAVEQAVVQNATKLEAPVVVVTGASRGIGKDIALTLGEAGCKVSSFFSFLEHAGELRIFILRGKEFSPEYNPAPLFGPGGGL